MTMNKTGGDKIISVYWFVILFIVAAAIVYMVFSFYGKPYDIRELEANALTNRVADCVSQTGYLREEVLIEGFNENLLEQCNLNFEVEDACGWKEQGQYYVEIEILDFNPPNGKKIPEISAGNSNLKIFCADKGESLPFCLKRSLYVIDRKNTQYQVNILSIVRKTEKNAGTC
ncbi:hypothetical protein J4422_03415 [Candidatus Pacearchaeota archaeon]|nr:hypothetical protein [Candidatus Pacearchaeota archaeon]